MARRSHGTVHTALCNNANVNALASLLASKASTLIGLMETTLGRLFELKFDLMGLQGSHNE